MTRTKRRHGIRRTFLAFAAVCLLIAGGLTAKAKDPTSEEEPRITISVRSSRTASLYSTLSIENSKLARQVASSARVPADNADFFTDIEISVRSSKGGFAVYRLEKSGLLWNDVNDTLLKLPPDASKRLLRYSEALRKQHYGKLIAWNEAKKIVTRKSFFTITDLETGLSFRVQRRAGSSHADVQPVSREDSKLMKQIYGGSWSWDRRAIVVTKDNMRIAASMNGMPHGGDGIPDNGFKGHFCVHFLNSTSHRSDTPDPAHQLMVHKATGDLRGYFDSASPRELAASFVEALNQKDRDMLQILWTDTPTDKQEALEQLLERLVSVYVQRTKKSATGDLEDELSAYVALPIVIRQKGGRTLHSGLRFQFERSLPASPWRIVGLSSDHSSLIP